MLRGKHGQVIIAAMKPEALLDDHLEVELLAIFRGVQLCVLRNISKLIVESDSLLTIRTMQKGEDLKFNTVIYFMIY